MKAHFKYLSYVIRHKWFVFIWCLKLGVPIHRAILHDWTKFLPCEWFPYVHSFYGGHISNQSDEYRRAVNVLGYWPENQTREYWRPRFDAAWNHHQKSNKHHWQYWLLTNDSDKEKHKALPIPQTYIREMVADWIGAGRAITGKYEFTQWYCKNKEKQIIHPVSVVQIEQLLTECGKIVT